MLNRNRIREMNFNLYGKEERALAVSIYGWMLRNVNEYIDSYTGEVNSTQLAEDCAMDLGHDEWLDEETHVVWDMAATVAEKVEKERK